MCFLSHLWDPDLPGGSLVPQQSEYVLEKLKGFWPDMWHKHRYVLEDKNILNMPIFPNQGVARTYRAALSYGNEILHACFSLSWS